MHIKHCFTIHDVRHLTWHNRLDSWSRRWSWLVWRGWGTVCFRGGGERLGRCHRFAFIQFGTRLITVPFLGRRFRLLIGDCWTVLFVKERIPCAFYRIGGVSWILWSLWTGFWSKNLWEKPQVTQYKWITVTLLWHYTSHSSACNTCRESTSHQLTVSNSLTRSSITMLWYFKFIIAAIVSSLDFINVGPNTTPRLLAAIKFLLEWAATLEGNKTPTDVINYVLWLMPEKHLPNIAH